MHANWQFERVRSPKPLKRLIKSFARIVHAEFQHSDERRLLGNMVKWPTFQWYFSFEIHFSFSFYTFYKQSFLFFYIITVLCNTIISVFISFASNHFYINVITVLSNTIVFVCMSFYAMNIKAKIIWFCLMCTVYQANTSSQTDRHYTIQSL